MSGTYRAIGGCAMMVRDVVMAAVMLGAASAAVGASQGSGDTVCKPAGKLVTLAALPEASGLAIGKGSGARLWMHNDSGAPELIAVDTAGTVTGRVALNGA